MIFQLPRNPPLSADLETNRSERKEVSIAPVTSRNGNNAVVTADDGFTGVKGQRLRRKPLALYHRLLVKIRSLRLG
jgi:hypothetical protein